MGPRHSARAHIITTKAAHNPPSVRRGGEDGPPIRRTNPNARPLRLPLRVVPGHWQPCFGAGLRAPTPGTRFGASDTILPCGSVRLPVDLSWARSLLRLRQPVWTVDGPFTVKRHCFRQRACPWRIRSVENIPKSRFYEAYHRLGLRLKTARRANELQP